MHGFSNLYFKTFFLSHSFIKVMLKHCFFLLPPLGWLIFMLLTKYFSRRLHRGQKLLQRLGWSSSASARSPSPHRGHGSVAGLYQWTPATRFWMSCIWAPLTYPLSRYDCNIAFLDAFTHTNDIMRHHGISKVGSVDIDILNTSSPWSKLKTGVSPLG